MAEQTLFSVIIPTFNRRPFLETAINSVLNQTFRDFELIIIDDGSTDGTERFVTERLTLGYNDVKRSLYKYQQNKGVASTRNKGLDLAKGKFIAFLDSDDCWTNNKLEIMEEYIKKFPNIKIFHTEEVWYKKGKLLSQKERHKKPSGLVYKNALPLCCISISTAVIKRDVFEDVGRFDETLEACEDYDFWLRATRKYEVRLIPEELTIKDGGGPDQLSQSVWGLDRFRIKALKKMLSSGTLTNEEYKWTLDELAKKCEIFAKGCEKRGKIEEANYYRKLGTAPS